MNASKMATALNTISVAFGELAEALTENGTAPVLAAPVADLFPPFTPEEPEYEALPLPADAPGLGRCPTHNLAWTVKPGGFSKRTNKTFSSFWHCDGKDADGGFCQKRPVKAWAEAHPLA